MDIEGMTTTIEALLDKDIGSGASSDIVQSVEKSLGVQFPDDYEAFLRRYGWARLKYDEVYGAGDSVPPHLDLVANTLRERADFRPNMPLYLIPVMPDGAGNHYCLDLSRTEFGVCPIVFWDHDQEETQIPEIVGPNFSEWIVDHVTEQA